MASKTSELSTRELEELLDTVELAIDRLKTLYESYFLGIQKQAPTFIHNDVERKLRDLQQLNMRNTGLRYRLATIQQKFGAYNSYWRRTLRQIENGTYIRNLAKIGREAARNGSEIPEEILAKMPKRMREQVVRDRDAAIAIAKRRNQVDLDRTGESEAPLFPPDPDEVAAMINEPSVLRRELKTRSSAHVLAEDDADLDFDSFFAAFDDDAAKPAAPKVDPASTQAITRLVPKVGQPVPGMLLRTPTPTTQPTTAMPRVPLSTPVPVADPASPTIAMPKIPVGTPPSATEQMPKVPPPGQPGAPATQPIPRPAPSQASRPNPIAPGSAQHAGPTPVESMNGPFPRPAERPTTQPTPRVTSPPAVPRAPGQIPRPPPPAPGRPAPPSTPRPPAAPMKPPPGMTEADVNALHAKYVQAKHAVGEKVDASSREKLLRTISLTAPKVMEQYKASGVDFSVVVKDNQVVIKAKPKG